MKNGGLSGSDLLAISVLEHLNHAAGTRFQMVKTSLGPIRERLSENFTTEELTLTVDYLVMKWGCDPKMMGYLRPSTVFRQDKFPGYLAAASNWAQAGRPCISGADWKRDVTQMVSADYDIPEGFRG